MRRFEGQTALVTGGAKGIVAAAAENGRLDVLVTCAGIIRDNLIRIGPHAPADLGADTEAPLGGCRDDRGQSAA